ncbi:MAG: TrkH family potassium uptake protein [Anaerofustis sp.]
MKLANIMNRIGLQMKRMTHPQILVIGFAALIITGALLLMLPIATTDGQGASFLTGLFTSTSAVCVTGLVVVDTGTYWTTFGQIIILLLIQIGGLGFMAMATLLFLITGKKITVKNRMLLKTSFSADSLEGIIRYVKYVMLFTLTVEMIGAVLLCGVFIPAYGVKHGIFMSVFHAVSAFCNAGFDIVGGGVGFMPFVTNVLLNLVICSLIVIGGIGFAVAMDVISKKRFCQFEFNTKIVLIATGFLILFGTVTVFISEYNNPETMGDLPFFGKVLASLFTSITPRTAGFNTVDVGSLHSFTKMVIMLLMFIGGSPGSTAGGVKTTSFSVFILAMVRTIQGYDEIRVYQRRINSSVIKKAMAITMLGIIWVLTATTVLYICEQQIPLGNLMFEVISAFGTVGLSTGITASLSAVSKVTLILTMFFGRVGLITVAYAINRFNELRNTMGSYKYPDGNLLL